MLTHHDPANGLYGDCFRACVASILELPTEAVPHVMAGCDEVGEEAARPAWERLDEFLCTLTPPLAAFGIRISDAEQFRTIVEGLQDNVTAHYILGGFSERGCHHAVVGCRGAIAHDPDPRRAGLLLDRFPMDLIFLVRR